MPPHELLLICGPQLENHQVWRGLALFSAALDGNIAASVQQGGWEVINLGLPIIVGDRNSRGGPLVSLLLHP